MDVIKHEFSIKWRISKVNGPQCAQLRNYGNFLHSVTHLWENNVFTKKMIWRNFFSVTVDFSFFHTALHSVEKREILSHWKYISWNQLSCNFFFFSKNIVFTKFLPKKYEREFPSIPHCDNEYKSANLFSSNQRVY